MKQQRIRLEKMVEERTRELIENNQILKNKTEELHHYNILLTERQKHIEEQSEELAAQKEELLTSKEQMEIANEALNVSNAAKDKLFSIIAHDLRTPFNSLLGMSELLYRNLDNWDNDKVQKIVELLHESAKQAYSLLENLLVWSRAQQNRITFNPVSLNLNALIVRNIELIAENARTKNIAISWKESRLPIEIIADEMMIDTVIRNLLSNAIKFTPKGGKISISVQNSGEATEVVVKDNGLGISGEAKPMIFRTNQYTSKGTEDENGTGLGLLICKEFIERHGGSIWFESEENKGAVFHFTLPSKKEG